MKAGISSLQTGKKGQKAFDAQGNHRVRCISFSCSAESKTPTQVDDNYC